VASLSPAIQAKLLTAIEDRVIRRVGGNRPLPINVRLITASLTPLRDLVAAGRFREDLFHRLDLLRLAIPPLRAFPADIPHLAEHLLAQLRTRYRTPDARLSAAAIGRLRAWPWPGNVRELGHELERELIFHADGVLECNQLQSVSATPPVAGCQLLNPAFQLPDSGFDLESELEALTRTLLNQAMTSANGNASAAARQLGVPRDFVRYRLKQD
jgi:two-component system, NtrC family, response regulator AtoC